MPEQPSSQENYSCPFQKARKTLAAPTFAIYIDQSYAVYNNYHNSQNQTTTEFVNSNNFSSTKARNSSLNGDTRSTFRAERAPSQRYPPTPVQNFPQTSSTGNENQGHSFNASAIPDPSRSQQWWHNVESYPPSSSRPARLPSRGFEGTDASPIGHGTSQPCCETPTSLDIGRNSISRYHLASRGLSQHATPTSGILANLPFLIRWVVTWFRTSTAAYSKRSSSSDGVV